MACLYFCIRWEALVYIYVAIKLYLLYSIGNFFAERISTEALKNSCSIQLKKGLVLFIFLVCQSDYFSKQIISATYINCD